MSLYGDDPAAPSAPDGKPIDHTHADLARMIDHTILKPEALPSDVDRFCQEALRFRFASVCVNGVYVPRVVAALAGSGLPACAVVGFPLGAMSSWSKAREASDALSSGAGEIDMVIHVGALKAGDRAAVVADIAAVKQACGPALLKVIIETCLLTDDEKRTACAAAMEAGAEFVKTSTGFGNAGATVEDVALMRAVVGDRLGVKASGGIRTRQDAERMIAAGATRIGASASVAIVSG